MFNELEDIFSRPRPYEFYTAADLWTDEYTSGQMLKFHLQEDVDLSSRRADFIERSVAWIASRFGVGPGASVADFGCGPGLYTSRLARLGADVTGIDFSARSIGYARDTAEREGLNIQYIHQNYLDLRPERRYDLIEMIFLDFCALSPAQRSTLLGIFGESLLPGGRVLLDVCSLAGFERREESARIEASAGHGFWSDEPYYAFVNSFKYAAEKVTLEKHTVVERGRTRVVYNWLQYFSRESLAAEFEACGFTIEDVYSDVAGGPFDPATGEFAVVARRA